MSAGDFLADMATSSRDRTEVARARVPASELRARSRDLPPAPRLRLSPQGFDLIAEMKLRSPAVGALRDARHEDVTQRVLAYADAGAAAVSVLTEPSRFDGDLVHLAQAAAALAPHGIPAMRKDFLVDPYQVLEARAAGAGGVLLILRMLPRAALEALLDAALEHGLFVLLEAFDVEGVVDRGVVPGDAGVGAEVEARPVVGGRSGHVGGLGGSSQREGGECGGNGESNLLHDNPSATYKPGFDP